jgi:carbamoyl-phosphate synthase small subunit
MTQKEIKLILEDGATFIGESFGYEGPSAGEVVFNTGMMGYPESFTDPSYQGQILVLTYPLIGNYGVPETESEKGVLKNFESEKIRVSGLIITEYSEKHSHWNARKSLSDWLKENKIPAIQGIDTRALTKILREKGTMLGKIILDQDIPFYDPNKDNLVDQVSIKEKRIYTENAKEGSKKILLIDCGVKSNIIRCFLKRGATVIRVPWNHDISQEEYDGLFISNGPGDPKMCKETIQNLSTAIKQDKPIFGICLGNQLLALAAGGNTYKLKYGHRSQNQPCMMQNTKKCYITSQNHGFAVDAEKLPPDWEPYFMNANDGTCEGIRHKTKKIFSVQFHPEASCGPVDTEFLFDEFLKMIEK